MTILLFMLFYYVFSRALFIPILLMTQDEELILGYTKSAMCILFLIPYVGEHLTLLWLIEITEQELISNL